MRRNKVSIVVYVIIALAVIGFFSKLFTSPATFITNIFIMLGVSLLIMSAFYFIFLKKRSDSNEMKKYKRAVKQSQLKYKQNNQHNKGNSHQSIKAKKKSAKRAHHLRVIDGNKTKRRDRATF